MIYVSCPSCEKSPMQITGNKGNRERWTCPSCGWSELRPSQNWFLCVDATALMRFDSRQEAMDWLNEQLDPVVIEGAENCPIPKRSLSVMSEEEFNHL